MTQRLVRAALAALALFVVLLSGREAGAAPPLRWGADAEGGAPYVFADPKDPSRRIGFEVDLAEALAAELGEPIVFTQYDYKSLLTGLDRGDIDLAMNGLEVTPERKERVRFSSPYYVYEEQLVVRATDHRFDDLDGCKRVGCVVGTLEETAAERILDARGIHKRIYDGQVEPYQDLGLSRVDAVLLDVPIVVYYAARDARLRLAGRPFAKGHYAIAFKRDRVELAGRFDAALLRLAEKGELQRIYASWSLWTDAQRELAGVEPKTVVPPPSVTADSARSWRLRDYLPLLFDGAKTTVFITLVSMTLAVLLGVPIALARLYGPRPLAWLATGYVELFRGIPVLLLLYFLYYGLPVVAEGARLPFALKLSPLEASILGFSLNYAAYEAEVHRAGIASIPVGQWEAAASLGMGRWLTFRRIIVPQAVRVSLPPMTNDLIALFKDTSIVSIISVVELSKQYQILSKSSMKYLEIGAVTAALYLVMSVPLGWLSRRLERAGSAEAR